MKTKFGKNIMVFFRRDFIQKNEGKLSYFQLAGFALIFFGLLYMVSFLLPSGIAKIKYLEPMALDDAPTSYGISISFFTTMLGVSFAFPRMLQSNDGEASTMRIVVFMLVNVICMLILKVGWDKNNLTEIGLNEYWVGIIAFLFGAKATQAYFENKKMSGDQTDVSTMSKSEIAKHFELEKSTELKAKYSNIESVSATINKAGEDIITLYLKDSNTELIPKELTDIVNGREIRIKTQIIPDAGVAIPHLGQDTDELSDSKTATYKGSICCIVDSITNPAFKGVVTSGHVFTYGDSFDYGGVLGPSNRRQALINGTPQGNLYFQQMKYDQDIAIIQLTNTTNLTQNYISFKEGFYQVTKNDLRTSNPNVTLASRNRNKKQAFVLDYNVSFEIKYYNGAKLMRNIILIGNSNDPETSSSVSKGGDSGGCVYHTDSEKLIGILLGGNNKFSFVLPIEETLNSFNFKIT